jgi:hypothetical protein
MNASQNPAGTPDMSLELYRNCYNGQRSRAVEMAFKKPRFFRVLEKNFWILKFQDLVFFCTLFQFPV